MKKVAQELVKIAKQLSVTKKKLADAEDLNGILDDVEGSLGEAIQGMRLFISHAKRDGKTRLAGEAQSYILPHLESWKEDNHQPGSIPSLRDGIEEDEEEEKGE